MKTLALGAALAASCLALSGCGVQSQYATPPGQTQSSAYATKLFTAETGFNVAMQAAEAAVETGKLKGQAAADVLLAVELGHTALTVAEQAYKAGDYATLATKLSDVQQSTATLNAAAK